MADAVKIHRVISQGSVTPSNKAYCGVFPRLAKLILAIGEMRCSKIGDARNVSKDVFPKLTLGAEVSNLKPNKAPLGQPMNKRNLPIVAAIGGILVISAVYFTNQLTGRRVENPGINMITAAAVGRAGATIAETTQPSKP